MDIQARRMWRVSRMPNKEGCERLSVIFPEVFRPGQAGFANVANCIAERIGTDLNRNYDEHWATAGSTGLPGADTYHGLSPADNIETQNIQRFAAELASENELLQVTDVHCCVGMWLIPWGWSRLEAGYYPEKTYNKPPDYDRMIGAAKASVEAIQAVNHKPLYRYGSVTTTIYPAAGSSLDYFYDKLGVVFASAPELYQPEEFSDNPILWFQPRQTHITPAIREAYAGMLAGVQYALSHRGRSRASTPFASPGYSKEWMCKEILEHDLLDSTCNAMSLFTDNITEQPERQRGHLDLNDDHFEPMVRTRYMPAACGTYMDKNGRLVEFAPGVPLRNYCAPESTHDATLATDQFLV